MKKTVRVIRRWCLPLSWGLLSVALLPEPAKAGGINPDIVLVRGTTSMPDARERNYALKVTQRLSRWLSDVGIEHRTIEDEDTGQGLPATGGVAVLAYNTFPPAREMADLREYVGRGGKLVVFYASHEALAKLLDMRLGAYRKCDTFGCWTLMRFGREAPVGMPETVAQTSRNIRAVYPADGKSSVLARWQSADGKYAREPAWCLSEKGAWMSHVLLDDGDTWNKKLMLVSLLAHFEPSVWAGVARHLAVQAETLERYDGFDDLVADLRASASRHRKARVEALLSHAQTYRARVRQHLREHRYVTAISDSRTLRNLLVEAYVSGRGPSGGERRAFWNHSGTGLYPGDWERTCRLVARSGFTDLMPNLLWPGSALYLQTSVPASETCGFLGDQLAACLDAAHRQGLRVHVWKVCWRLDRAPATLRARLQGEGRLQRNDKGEMLNWLCPSDPRNLRMEKDSVRDIVRNYAVDGIHLDYVRYRDSHACYCDGCRTRFEQRLGKKAVPWPDAVRQGALRRDYTRWRCEQITRLVRDLSVAVKNLRPGVELSAAVFGRYPLCRESVGQDWGDWLTKGYVDFVCPMNYTEDVSRFRQYALAQAALQGAERILPGIGATASGKQLGPVQVIDQISIVRALGFRGFAVFDLNRKLETDILPHLNATHR